MSNAPRQTRFDRDTAVTAEGDGRYRTRIDDGWWIARGPNGGYLAAILLRAIVAEVGDPGRAPRSLTVHFLAPPVPGAAEVEVTVERSGRSLASVSARLVQDGRVMATALAALSKPFASHEGLRLVMPEVAPPEELDRIERRIPINDRYDVRRAVGDPPFSGSPSALTGSWIRLTEPRELDAVLLAAFADALSPAIFPTLADREAMQGVPTVDLTVHFRTTLPVDVPPGEFVLAIFRSRHSEAGFVEEDGEIWSRDGRLLAQSRQLAVHF